MMRLWCYAWAYVFEVLALLDKAADWAAYQIDHNDYLAGFLFAVALFAIPYLLGCVGIVIGG